MIAADIDTTVIHEMDCQTLLFRFFAIRYSTASRRNSTDDVDGMNRFMSCGQTNVIEGNAYQHVVTSHCLTEVHQTGNAQQQLLENDTNNDRRATVDDAIALGC